MTNEVVDKIGVTVKELEKQGGFTYNYVSGEIKQTAGTGTAIFQTEPISYGKGTVLLQLNINTSALSGMSVDDVDTLFRNSKTTFANSLQEALEHESGHAKLISGRSYDEILSLYGELKDKGITGLSAGAELDGAEAIADIEVKQLNNITLTEEEKQLYNRYMR